MSDDMWRQREPKSDPSEEFGGPLFPDEDPDAAADRPDDTGERKLRFGPNDTGPLPHWTEPPTGEVPRMAPAASGAGGDDDDDVDVWSSFTTESPVWRDDVGDEADPSGGFDHDLTGEVRTDSLSEPLSRPGSGEIPLAPPPRARAGTHHDRHRPVRRPAPPTGHGVAPARRAAAIGPPGRPSAHVGYRRRRRRATSRPPSPPAPSSPRSSSSPPCGVPSPSSPSSWPSSPSPPSSTSAR